MCFRFIFLLLSILTIFTASAQTVVQDTLNGHDSTEVYPQGFYYGKLLDADLSSQTERKVVAWQESEDNSSSNMNVYYQVFDANMNPVCSAQIATDSTVLDQSSPKVLVHQQDTTFVVVWMSNHTGDYDIYIKKFRLTDGSALTSDTRVNSYTSGRQAYPLLVIDYVQDELIVGFTDLDGQDGSLRGAYAHRIDYASFDTVGTEFLINTTTYNSQTLYSLAISPKTGELIAGWTSNASGQNAAIIRKMIRNGSGDFVGNSSEITLNSTNSDSPMLTVNSITGELIADWNQTDASGWGVYARVMDTAANTLKSNFLVNAIQTQNQRYGKPVWEETSGRVVFFYYYSYNSLCDIRYHIFDKDFNRLYNNEEFYALPSGSNLNNVYSDYSQKFDNKQDRILLGYREDSTLNGPYTKIFVKQLSFVFPYTSVVDIDKVSGGAFYTTVDSKIYFRYREEYASVDSLDFSIYDYTRMPVLGTATLQKQFGVNYETLDLSGFSLQSGKFYTLEITDEKKKVYRMKFLYE